MWCCLRVCRVFSAGIPLRYDIGYAILSSFLSGPVAVLRSHCLSHTHLIFMMQILEETLLLPRSDIYPVSCDPVQPRHRDAEEGEDGEWKRADHAGPCDSLLIWDWAATTKSSISIHKGEEDKKQEGRAVRWRGRSRVIHKRSRKQITGRSSPWSLRCERLENRERPRCRQHV